METTGSTISKTVQMLLTEKVNKEFPMAPVDETPAKMYSRLLAELAKFLNVTSPYMPRKLKNGTWTADDIDKLAEFFGKRPVDFLRPKR